METIPLELLTQICVLLHNSHPQSLIHGFSLTSKRCRTASRPEIFRHFRIRAGWPDEIAPDLHKYHEWLESAAALSLVHTLEIVPSPLRDDEYEDDDNSDAWGETTESSEKLWLPLAKLLKHLHSLRHFIYAFEPQLAKCLEEALSVHLPSCQVHLNSFRFQRFEPLQAFDLKLVRLQNLVSLKTRWNKVRTNATMNYTYEALMDMIGGLAPNLRCVHLEYKRAKSPAALHHLRRFGFWRKPWQGFPMEWRSTRGRLCEFQFSQPWPLVPDDLQIWLQYIDFSDIRSLCLGHELTAAACVALSEMQFPSLHTLGVPLQGDESVRFVCGLRPLRRLDLHGTISASGLESILEHHGSTLRSLSLPEDHRTQLDQVKLLRSYAKTLDKLKITIARSKGDPSEVAIYEALGSLPHLQSLELLLDASQGLAGMDGDQTFLSGYFGSPSEGPLYTRACDALVNSALDTTLAKAIFWKIAGAKPAGFALETLVVRSCGGGSFGQSVYFTNVQEAFDEVSRSWKVERNVRDDQRNNVTVEELERDWDDPEGELSESIAPMF